MRSDNLKSSRSIDAVIASLASTVQQHDRQIGDLSSQIKGVVTAIESQSRELRLEIKALATDFVQARRPNWAIWASMAGVVVAMSGVGFAVLAGGLSTLWMVTTLKVDSATIGIESNIKPIADKVAVSATNFQALNTTVSEHSERLDTVIAQNSDSNRDRADLNRKTEMNQAALSDLRAAFGQESSERKAKQIEIETQFNADAQLRNVQFSDQQRKNAELQNSLHEIGAIVPEYPKSPFYQPNISQDHKVEP